MKITDSSRNPVEVLAEEFFERRRRGETPTIKEYADKYPKHATEIHDLFPALAIVEDLGDNLDDMADSAPGAVVDEDAKRKQLGDYRILREVGRGGMGVVYEAEQVSLGRKVALKVLPFAAMLDQRQLQRFQNEARAAASLRHPSIVQVHFVGCERAVHFYAMDYIEGQTLAELIQHLRRLEGLEGGTPGDSGKGVSDLADSLASGRFAPAKGSFNLEAPTVAYAQDQTPGATSDTKRQPQAAISTERSTKNPAYFRSIAEIGVQVAEALDHAHEHGVIHRDVKPSNVILDNAGKPWVTDFGLARIETDATLTVSGDLLGTVRYMSPEQALAKRIVVDHRTDVYSLGVTLYELLTLQPVFSGQDRQELLRQIAFDEPQSPRRLNKAVPAELETIILKAMAKNPAERYDTAQELADELKRFLEDRPIRARRPTLWQRSVKWSRRHKPVVAAAALIMLLVTVSGTAAAVRRHQHIGRLNEAAEDGIDEARLAMATKQYGRAHGRLTGIKEQLAGEPALAAEFQPALDELLLRAAAHLRIQQFESLAKDARFAACPHLTDSVRSSPQGMRLTRDELRDRLERARSKCEETLGVFDILAAHDWSAQLKADGIDEDTVASIRDVAVEILFMLARVEYQLGKLSNHSRAGARRAVDLMECAGEMAPDLRSVYEYRGLYWEVLGETEAAKADAERAGTMQPTTWLDHFMIGQLKGVSGQLDHLDAALTFKVDDYWTWFHWGACQRGLLHRDRAIWAMTVCINLEPNEPAAFERRSHDLKDLGRIASALEDADKALQLARGRPERAAAYYARAYLYKMQGRLDAAVSDLSEAIALAPTRPWFWQRRANFYLLWGRKAEAEADARHVLQMIPEPKNAPDHGARARAFRWLGETENEIRELEKQLELATNHASRTDIQCDIASAYRKLGNYRLAEESLGKGLELSPDNDELLAMRGTIRSSRGDFDAALEDLTRAIQLAPKNHRHLQLRGELYLRIEDYSRASQDLTQSLENAPENGTACKLRAKALFHLGEYEQALADLERALDLNPAETGTLVCIPLVVAAKCPDKAFRQGILRLAERAVDRSIDTNRARRDRLSVFLALDEKRRARNDLAMLLTEDNKRHYEHYQHALICLVMDDAANYRESCETMLERLADTEDPMAAHFTAWTCSLAPEAVESYERAIALANKAVQMAPESDQYLNSLGATLYRAGRTDEAIARLTELDRRLEDPNAGTNTSPAYTWYFLAMAHHKAGNEERAREYLNKANQRTGEVLAEEENPPAWNRRATLELLRKEAETSVGADVQGNADSDQEPERESSTKTQVGKNQEPDGPLFLPSNKSAS